MSKMFVHYSGTKAAFAAAKNSENKLLSEVYNNHIVFIKGEAGECIYTHGQYYGDVKAAIAALEGRMTTAEGKISANETAIDALKYFSQIKVGDKVAAANSKEGTITFAAVNPQEVSIDVDAHGLTFGLSEEFTTKVNTAASQAAAAAVKSEVNASIQALGKADSDLGDRVATIEASLGIEGEGQDGIGARLTTAEEDIEALEGLMSGDEGGSVNARIEAAKGVASADATSKANAAETAAKGHADSLNTAMNTRMESAEGSIATLTGDGEGSVAKALADANAYTDAEIVKVTSAASTLEGRVKANEDALGVLNGEATVAGSVKKSVADAIAGVVASAPADFDTLKEVADWIASDTTGAAKMQIDIARLDGADDVEGSVKKQIKDAVATEKGRAEGEEAAIRSEFAAADATLKTDLEGQITAAVEGVNKTIEDNELVVSNALNDLNTRINEANDAYVAADTALKSELEGKISAEESRATGVENGLNTRLATVEGDYLKSADKTELQGKINAKVAQSDYDAKIAELEGFWAWEEIGEQEPEQE